MAPKWSEGATKDLRVINSVDPSVFKSNYLDYRIVIVPLQLSVTSRQRENVAVISSNRAGNSNFIYRSPVVNVGATIDTDATN